MTYEYACGACGNEWEAEQSISEAPLKTCPKCGKHQAKRLVSGGTGFLLKGGGWYADGYGSTGGKKSSSDGEAKADTKTTESKPSTDSSSSESKTEPKKKPDGKGKSAAA